MDFFEKIYFFFAQIKKKPYLCRRNVLRIVFTYELRLVSVIEKHYTNNPIKSDYYEKIPLSFCIGGTADYAC